MNKAPKSFYVTTPIYYANSTPHIGHAYTSILADVVTRIYALFGSKTFFLTGTDEHGDKIAKAAKAQNKTPQQLVDENSVKFRELLPIINAQNDDFIRTTEERHKKVVQHLLQKVYDKGDIYFGEYGGKYCVGCERYYGDDELVDGKCPDHQTVPEQIMEKNYFFKMSAHWKKLEDHVKNNPQSIVPEGFRKEVEGLLRMGAQDLCISRPKSRLEWGIELPFDKNYVTYVWFDALINYISALGYPDSTRFDEYWPCAHHVIAKDILKPHCIYWPTMLLSMGIALPKQIAIHGYWLMDNSKMSKSLGNVADPVKYSEKYGSDYFRYYLIRGMRFGKDASFTHADFLAVVNADLANKVGNLYSRICGLLRKYHGGQIPAVTVNTNCDHLKNKALGLPQELFTLMQTWELQDYATTIIGLAEDVNKYLDENKPWSEIKGVDTKEKALSVLKNGLESVRLIYAWLWPIMPQTCEKVLAELGLGTSVPEILATLKTWEGLKVGHALAEAPTGFPRIEEKEA